MTHPFHPLYGQEFEYVTHNKCWGVNRVSMIDSEEQLFSLPMQWTSASVADPFLVQAGDRCIFHFSELLTLARLLQELRSVYPSLLKEEE